jgi:TM2 domain-containing membrane protein YozV
MTGAPPPYDPRTSAPPPPGYPQPDYLTRSPDAPWGYDPRSGLPYSDKQKIVAGLLQLFLGGFGVGRFYTGHTGMAIAQIAVTFLTCGLGALWPFIDGILMLTGNVTDANGRPLRD